MVNDPFFFSCPLFSVDAYVQFFKLSGEEFPGCAFESFFVVVLVLSVPALVVGEHSLLIMTKLKPSASLIEQREVALKNAQSTVHQTPLADWFFSFWLLVLTTCLFISQRKSKKPGAHPKPIAPTLWR